MPEVKVRTEDNATVTISKKEYEQLVRDSDFLNCLEACGVDNWGGYGDAQEMLDNPTE